MIGFFNKSLYFFFIILHFFISRSFLDRFKLRLNQLYTIWKVFEFKSFGENVFIHFPLYLKGGRHISVGKGFECDQRLRLDGIDFFLGDKFYPEIVIGDFVSIQKDCHIGAINKIVIGNNVLIASKVFISDHFHGLIEVETLKTPPAKRKLFSKGPIFIEDNVWIGEGVVILGNVRIGKNCIVGANSVVNKSFPENCVIAGNPAKLIKVLC